MIYAVRSVPEVPVAVFAPVPAEVGDAVVAAVELELFWDPWW
jgi:hypothetical protein